MRYPMMVALVAIFFVGLAALEVRSWQECLGSHSWWYCFRILSR